MFNFVDWLTRKNAWSLRTFGPDPRVEGVVAHMRKELVEVEQQPSDLMEWVDLVFLATDGAFRQGFSPEQIADALEAKLVRNQNRAWPDWRTADPKGAIEHDRSAEDPPIDGNS